MWPEAARARKRETSPLVMRVLGLPTGASCASNCCAVRVGVPATVVRKHFENAGADGGSDTITRILDGSIDIIVNTPYGVGARLDGYEIRSAAVTKGVPCITTVQGLAAAVQGIEALLRDEVGVRSLQEHAADLRRARGGSS